MAGAGKEYTLGRGKLYFEQFVAGTVAGKGELYFGNTPEASFTAASETLDHYDSDEGLNVLDEQVQTKVDWTGSFTSDNISKENLALFFQSAGATVQTITSGTGLTSTITSKKGRFFQIGKSTSNPSGARNITVTGIALASLPGTPITPSGNYTVDAALGRVFIPTTSSIADDADLIVTYDVAAGTRNLVISSDQQIRGALRFIANNPVGGQKDYFFPYVVITPDGDYALKGEDWQTLGFSFTVLKLSSTTERVYSDIRS